MDWTAGYASDIEYTAGFYQEQSPHYLNLICALNSVEPIALDRPFTYCELGFGRGLTVNLLAAANPMGRFYATDFNPAHVAGAQEMARHAGLDNLVLLEESFAELADGKADLPQFDFITLHGIYTWVTAENRAHITAFIARYLKPGGIVYVSYNAMPGWAAATPLQRLLVEYGDMFPNRSDIQLKGGAGLVKSLVQANAGYFLHNPQIQSRVEGLEKHSGNYLVHEYMHKHWQPLYHADVARDFTVAKLEFAGVADGVQAYPQLYLSQEVRDLLSTLPDPVMRETIKDYAMNNGFRKDVYVRGARKLTGLRRVKWLGELTAMLLVSPDSVSTKMALSVGEVNCKPELILPVKDALALRPHTLSELAQCPPLRQYGFEDIVQACVLLSSSGQIALYRKGETGVDPEKAQAMNRALAAETRYCDDFPAFAAPRLGNGILIPYVERLVFLLLSKRNGAVDAQEIAAEALQIMQAQGRLLMRGGKAIESAEELLAELLRQVHTVQESKLAFWRQLQLL